MATKKLSKKTIKKTVKKAKKQKKALKKTRQKKTVKKKTLKRVAKQKKPVKAKKIASVPSKAKTKKSEKASDEQREALRRFLIQKREQIVKEAKSEISKYIKGETRQLVDTALDDGDWSIVDLSEDISLRQLGSHRETLVKIDAAIRKLDEGTYGICDECGEEISKERLKVLPFAVYCRDCQEKIEQFEAMKKTLPI